LETSISNVLDVLPTKHYHSGGVFIREAEYPAGCFVVGRVHLTDHLFVLLSGKLTVWTKDSKKTFTAPCVIESKAGTQRFGYFHQRGKVLNIHTLSEKLSEDEVFDHFTVASEDAYLRWRASLVAPEVSALQHLA
jgi:hypothetical protein